MKKIEKEIDRFKSGDYSLFNEAVAKLKKIEDYKTSLKERIPNGTGSYSLDYDLVCPIADGGIFEIFGDEGSGKCIDKDSFIVSNKGILPILDLFNENNVSVANRDGKYKKVAYYYSNNKSDVICMETILGNKIIATPNHKILIWRNAEYVWSRMDKLLITDIIPISRKSLYCSNYSLLDHFDDAYIYGLLIGDGGLTYPNRIALSNTDSAIIKSFYAFAQRNKIKVLKYDNDYHINSKKIRNLLDIPLCNSYTKIIPRIILKSSVKDICNFIAGYFDADGCIQGNTISFSSVSKTLLIEIQNILFALGIISSVCYKKGLYKGKKHISWNLLIRSQSFKRFLSLIHLKSYKKNQLIQLMKRKHNDINNIIPNIEILVLKLINLRQDWYRENEKIYNFIKECKRQCKNSPNTNGITYYRLNKLLLLTNHFCKYDIWKKLKNIYDCNYCFVNIKSIKKSKKYTYDLHVPDGNEFIANGIINHNTTLALEIVGQALLRGRQCFYLNQERGLNRQLLKTIRTIRPFIDAIFVKDGGIKENSPLKIDHGDTGEQALEIVRIFVSQYPNSLAIVDSIDACVPEAILAGEIGAQTMGSHGKLMSDAIRKIVGVAETNNSTVVFINQIRDKMTMFGSPLETPGGKAVRFYAWQRIQLRKPKKDGYIVDADKNTIGHNVHYNVIKNKFAPGQIEGEFPILYYNGIFREQEIVTLAIKLGVLELGGKGGGQVILPILDKNGIPEKDKTLSLSKFNAGRRLLSDPSLMNYLDNQIKTLLINDRLNQINPLLESDDAIQDS